MDNFDDVTELKTFSYGEGEVKLFAHLIRRGDKFELLTQKAVEKPVLKEYKFLVTAEDAFKWFVIENVPFLEEHERNNNCQH